MELVEETAEVIKPAHEELIRQAAQGEVLHNDDTSMRVLQMERDPSDERRGVFTSGIVSTHSAGKSCCTSPGVSFPRRTACCFHQQHSGPIMDQLHDWLEAELAEKRTEPNSGLGKAMTYLLRHWKGLTTFLRAAVTPVDNNICERALKRAVLHRKNALFYKTLHGAEVGDVFMSLIHTCQLCGANSFDYLTELQRHASELAANPADWMPRNYRDAPEHDGAI
jgi:hypothetical protein